MKFEFSKIKLPRRFNWRRWLDEFSLAGQGILLATREKRFLLAFLISFLFFGTLMNLLASGFSKFELMGALGFPESLKIIGSAFVGVFGVNMIFADWLFVFFIAVLQGILIGLIVLLWKKEQKKNENSANVEKAGIVAGLIALGAGCPTCGTTLLTPLLGTIFSTGGLAATGVISGIVTVLAIIIAILSLKRIGLQTYAIIKNEKFMEKRAGAIKS